ncbi:MAG: hypothetical protein ACLF0P_07455 [Thermoanaerobaculia bacterium]
MTRSEGMAPEHVGFGRAAAVNAAEAAGGEVAVPPTEIPGHGTFAIYFLGGIQHGLWEL